MEIKSTVSKEELKMGQEVVMDDILMRRATG